MKSKSMHSAGFAKQRDANEPGIVLALEAVGASVTRVSMLGVPDLLVGFKGSTYLIEVKNGKAKLNDNQEKWWGAWNGKPAIVVRTIEEALAAIGIRIVTPGMYYDDAGNVQTYPRSIK